MFAYTNKIFLFILTLATCHACKYQNKIQKEVDSITSQAKLFILIIENKVK